MIGEKLYFCNFLLTLTRSLNTVCIFQMLTPILMADTVYNHQEITLEEKKTTHPTFAQVGRVHELHKKKIHKDYKYIPSICSITYTTNIMYYGIAKYWSSVLNTPTENKFSIRLI